MRHLFPKSGLSDAMWLTLAVWLCSLIAIGLFVVPLVGPRVAAIVAVGLFIALLIACWSICAYQLSGNNDQRR